MNCKIENVSFTLQEQRPESRKFTETAKAKSNLLCSAVYDCIFLLYSDHVIVDESKLHLRDVLLTNDGVYQCVAENKYGMLVSATWVHVKGTGTFKFQPRQRYARRNVW